MPITIKRIPGEPVMLRAGVAISTNFQYTKADFTKRVATLTEQLTTAPPDPPPTFTIEGLLKEQLEQIRDALWFRGQGSDEALSNALGLAYSEAIK